MFVSTKIIGIKFLFFCLCPADRMLNSLVLHLGWRREERNYQKTVRYRFLNFVVLTFGYTCDVRKSKKRFSVYTIIPHDVWKTGVISETCPIYQYLTVGKRIGSLGIGVQVKLGTINLWSAMIYDLRQKVVTKRRRQK